MKTDIQIIKERTERQKLIDYPEELTEDEADNYEFFDIKEKPTYEAEYKEAVKIAKKNKGQVYTMVDGENNKTYYLKGMHFVNRFGFKVLRKVEK